MILFPLVVGGSWLAHPLNTLLSVLIRWKFAICAQYIAEREGSTEKESVPNEN